MKNIFFAISFLLLNTFTAIVAKQDYWQQEVHYDIKVKLNDVKHELDGLIEITYTNHSPDELSFIYFHLWPNAYKNQSTAFAQQMLENGEPDFYFSKKSERGYIDGLDFKVGKQTLAWSLDEKHIDIAKVALQKPLKNGETVVIKTPFKVKLPKVFSRLGHTEQSYNLTQWYPKPAVYDKDGWHPMPYLDQGEFYSEFGSFEVYITLPQNYVVGATGDLQNEEEIQWLNNLAKKGRIIKEDLTNAFPPSNREVKTLHYKQEKVHDFAWFADKRYIVRKGKVTLPESKSTVTTWAMFLPESQDLWVESIDYINAATLFYSDKVGEYPYNQVTAVESASSVGGSMEYPNVTIIKGASSAYGLEVVILHEVGHNWFYGILGSNEREHAWLDEGINSYYERRFLKAKYPDFNLKGNSFKNKLLDVTNISYFNWEYLDAQQTKHHCCHQAINCHSAKYTQDDYYASVYGKAALALEYLEAWLGKPLFDKAMQLYYEQLQFKHAQGEDIQQVFEDVTGKYVDWFFNDLINKTDPLDYILHQLQPNAEQIGERSFDQVTVRNRPTSNAGPFSISALQSDSIVHTIWYDGFHGQEDILFPSMNYDALKIDAIEVMPETNRSNNTIKKKGVFKKIEQLKLQPIGSIKRPDRTQLFFSPTIGFNNYDKFMLGMAFYNSIMPRTKFEYALMPMYAFGSKTFSGLAEFKYNWRFRNGFIDRIQIGIDGRTFGVSERTLFGETPEAGIQSTDVTKLYRAAPFINVAIRPKTARSPIRQNLSFRHVYIYKDGQECPQGSRCSNGFVVPESYYVNELKYTFRNQRTLNPFGFSAYIHQSQDFQLMGGVVNYKFSYPNKLHKKGVEFRLFGSGFFNNDTESGGSIKQIGLTDIGTTDYLFDDFYVDRNVLGGFWSRHIGKQAGGFKVPSSIGRSKEWVASLGIEADIPASFYLPIQLYAELGMSGNLQNLSDLGVISSPIVWSTGLIIHPWKDVVEIYVPLLLSDTYTASLDSFIDRISFRIQFSNMKARRQIETFVF